MSDQAPGSSDPKSAKAGEALVTMVAFGLICWFFYEFRMIWLPPLMFLWAFAQMFAAH